ncbi:protein AKTIP homolog [Clytia hemisphaerica]|uniref:UBC core domain-containing protein n=1 Tax=Clytia hemisphaerica TaxID=252671 RepID=A0A7M5X7X2_9CNID
MFKSQNRSSFAQQLKNKFSFSSPQRDANRNLNKRTTGVSGDKRMPQIPSPEEETMMHQSLKDKMTPNNNEYISSYGPLFLEYSIAAEYNHLKKTKIPGVYCIPSYHDPLIWFGVVFIRQGVYQNGVFRFTMTIPPTYPDGDCPSLVFTPPVFHPFIDPTTGALPLARAFGNGWKPNVNHLWQILLYVRRIFYKFDSKDATNPQAAELLLTGSDNYRKKIEGVISEINNTLFDDLDNDDPHAFRFREWNDDLHQPIKESMMSGKEEPVVKRSFEKPKLSGLSYIEPGTSWIFSKET